MNEQKFFKSAFSVDNIIFGFDNGILKVLLIKRSIEPYNKMWALPGDLVYPTEDLETAASRVLKELTGLENVFLQQVKTFGRVNRHPLGRVITVTYFSLINTNDYHLNPASFASKTQWHPIGYALTKPLAFDHQELLRESFNKLKQMVRTRPIGFELLPTKFTLTQLQQLYEAILETALDKRNFRKKILSMDLLIDCAESQAGVPHRPAKLYKFDNRRYEKLLEEGFNFELRPGKDSKSKVSYLLK